MIYLKNPLCLGMEESEYKEMLALGGMRQKHFEKNEVILSAGCTTHEIGLVLSGSVNIENLDLFTYCHNLAFFDSLRKKRDYDSK